MVCKLEISDCRTLWNIIYHSIGKHFDEETPFMYVNKVIVGQLWPRYVRRSLLQLGLQMAPVGSPICHQLSSITQAEGGMASKWGKWTHPVYFCHPDWSENKMFVFPSVRAALTTFPVCMEPPITPLSGYQSLFRLSQPTAFTGAAVEILIKKRVTASVFFF